MWLYKKTGKEIKKQPLEYVGYVYRITVVRSPNIPVELHDKIYIGKKLFNYSRKRKLSKKKRAGTRKKVEKITLSSGWEKYYGSSKELIQDIKDYGAEYFKREILHLCYTKAQCSYYEIKEQIEHEVMFCNSYNKWLNCRIFKNRFLQKIDI